MGDIDNVKVIFMGDAIYFLNKNLDPSALGFKPFKDIFHLMELSNLVIFIPLEDLETLDIDVDDLISYNDLKIVNFEKISQLIMESDYCFKY